MITGSFFGGLLAGLMFWVFKLRPLEAIVVMLATMGVLIIGAGSPLEKVIATMIGAIIGYLSSLYVSPIKK